MKGKLIMYIIVIFSKVNLMVMGKCSIKMDRYSLVNFKKVKFKVFPIFFIQTVLIIKEKF